MFPPGASTFFPNLFKYCLRNNITQIDLQIIQGMVIQATLFLTWIVGRKKYFPSGHYLDLTDSFAILKVYVEQNIFFSPVFFDEYFGHGSVQKGWLSN
jgi:hypothetical protein